MIQQAEIPDLQGSVEVTSETLFCLCKTPWDINNRKFMIQCDHCHDWLHGTCVNLTEEEAKDIEKYHCPTCIDVVGPSTFKSPTKKKKKPLRCSPEFISKLKEYKFIPADELVLPVLGSEITIWKLISKGFSKPMIVEKPHDLNMVLPPDTFSVRDVERLFGPDRMVDVIDVQRQCDTMMSMKEYADYFTSENRSIPMNLISLEFSNTDLSQFVEAPLVVRKLDWVATTWPNFGVDEGVNRRPYVAKYCLISCKDSYTDFHIDFGGTSVWYHVLWGEKIFYVIEPTADNLMIYQRWLEGEFGDECFLADEVTHCFEVVVRKGQTLFIPTGWIHAVYTPMDSLVFGGNFLHKLNMELQLKVYDMEKRADLPLKYLFPSFEATHWFAARSLIEEFRDLNKLGIVPPHMLRGFKALVKSLKLWASDSEKGISRRREPIPAIIDHERIIFELNNEVQLAETNAPRPTKRPASIKANIDRKISAMRKIPKLNQDLSENEKLTTPVASSTHLNGHRGTDEKPVSPGTSSDGGGGLKLKIRASSAGVAPFLILPDKEGSRLDSATSPSPIGSNEDLGNPSSMLSYHSDSSDALHIAEPEFKERSKSKKKSKSHEKESDRGSKKKKHHRHHHKHHRHHKSKCRKHHRSETVVSSTTPSKPDKSQIQDLNSALAGALDDFDELMESSNYTERIANCKETSQTVKETVADISGLSESSIMPNKSKKRDKAKHDSLEDSNRTEKKKSHQNEDFIYYDFDLDDDDDDRNSKKKKKRRMKRKVVDETWSPTQKKAEPKKVAGQKKIIIKGVTSTDNIDLTSGPQDDFATKLKKLRLATYGAEANSPSSSASKVPRSSKATKTSESGATPSSSTSTAPKRPKKGMATPKQRLGKILKLNKLGKF